MQPEQDCALVIHAVRMGVGQWTTSEAVALDSDRGTQVPAHEFQTFLSTHGS
ncbi:MAG TPA: hypothetical protein PKK23_06680 [Nitrospirales bacterium]|nr:hypothetical protein [Nitrospirales bacterium]